VKSGSFVRLALVSHWILCRH